MRTPPIRLRLTAWYLVVILASLALSSLAMYLGIQKAIEEAVDSQMQARSDSIRRFLETSPQKHASSPSLRLPSAAELGPSDELYQVADASGAMLYQSPAMRELEVPLNISQLQHHYRHHRDQGDFTTYYRRHSDVRVLASNVEIAGNLYQIQVGTDVNPFYAVLESFEKLAWVIIPLVVCLAGFGGYWLSGRAMKPVHVLVDSTRHISERSLSQRIALPAAQDELRELTETINAMLARLELAFARVTRFTADASHELRTPISVIRTTAEVILERERSREQIQEMAAVILREAEFTSALIEQLLTLARADVETAQVQLEPLDLRALVEELDAGSRTLAEARSLHWTMQIPNQPVLVLADRAHLRRLLLILIDNACRYTEAGGSISLSLNADAAHAGIEVKDTGIGIPPEELTHVFDRFYRASNARFMNPDGTGLGLPIAQWIAHAHRGTLSAHSIPGSGTCMSLRIPISAAME